MTSGYICYTYELSLIITKHIFFNKFHSLCANYTNYDGIANSLIVLIFCWNFIYQVKYDKERTFHWHATHWASLVWSMYFLPGNCHIDVVIFLDNILLIIFLKNKTPYDLYYTLYKFFLDIVIVNGVSSLDHENMTCKL